MAPSTALRWIYLALALSGSCFAYTGIVGRHVLKLLTLLAGDGKANSALDKGLPECIPLDPSEHNHDCWSSLGATCQADVCCIPMYRANYRG